MRIVIETLPHEGQRYDTVGDWWIDPEGTWQIRVSEFDSLPSELLVAIHELVEMALCLHAGVTSSDVDAFDLHFKGAGEAGDDVAAPYYRQHQIATAVERFMAVHLDVDWKQYEAAVDAL